MKYLQSSFSSRYHLKTYQSEISGGDKKTSVLKAYSECLGCKIYGNVNKPGECETILKPLRNHKRVGKENINVSLWNSGTVG